MTQDITHIKQLLATYCHRLDRGTAREVGALFAPDAVLHPRFDGDYSVRGRDAIVGWYAHYHQTLRPGLRNLMHMVSSIEITTSGADARACCYFTAGWVSAADNRAWLAYGTYTDALSRQGPNWLFAERTIETHFVIPGIECLEKVPSLGYPGAQ